MKKAISILAVLVLMATMSFSVLAADTDVFIQVDKDTVSNDQMNIVIPVKVDLFVAADGSVIVPTNYSISNYSAKAVVVTEMTTNVTNTNWTLAGASVADNALTASQLKMTIGGKNLADDTTDLAWNIAARVNDTPTPSVKALAITAKTGPQTANAASAKALDITYTVDWE